MKKLYSLVALLLLNAAIACGQPPRGTAGYTLNLVKQTDNGSKLLILYHFKGGSIWDLTFNKKIATTGGVQSTHYTMVLMPFFEPDLPANLSLASKQGITPLAFAKAQKIRSSRRF